MRVCLEPSVATCSRDQTCPPPPRFGKSARRTDDHRPRWPRTARFIWRHAQIRRLGGSAALASVARDRGAATAACPRTIRLWRRARARRTCAQIDHGVVAFVDALVQPLALDARLGHHDRGGEPAAMIAAGAIAGHQRRHQSIGQTPFCIFVGAGHRGDDFAARRACCLGRRKTVRSSSPTSRLSGGRLRGLWLAVRPLRRSRPIGAGRRWASSRSQFEQHFLGQLARSSKFQRRRAPGRMVKVLRAKSPHAAARQRARPNRPPDTCWPRPLRKCPSRGPPPRSKTCR